MVYGALHWLMIGINHFQGPDFHMQAQSHHVLHTVETPQNCRGGLENTFAFFIKFSYEDFDIKDKQKVCFLALSVSYVPVCLDL